MVILIRPGSQTAKPRVLSSGGRGGYRAIKSSKTSPSDRESRKHGPDRASGKLQGEVWWSTGSWQASVIRNVADGKMTD